MTLTLLALLCLQDDARFDELAKLRAERAAKTRRAAALEKEAHEALDRAEYEQAVAKHREARGLRADVAAGRLRETKIVTELATPLVKRLSDDDLAAREGAVAALLRLGPAAAPVLDAALKATADAETRGRLTDILARLRMMEMDLDGRVRQWASSARASSEYRATDWSASRATGAPDAVEGEDATAAWASHAADGGDEWLELDYTVPVLATHVRIHETYNPGAVIRVETADDRGEWHVVWTGQAAPQPGRFWFTVALQPAKFATSRIRLTLDSKSVPGWNEIDAVELVGEPMGR